MAPSGSALPGVRPGLRFVRTVTWLPRAQPSRASAQGCASSARSRRPLPLHSGVVQRPIATVYDARVSPVERCGRQTVGREAAVEAVLLDVLVLLERLVRRTGPG